MVGIRDRGQPYPAKHVAPLPGTRAPCRTHRVTGVSEVGKPQLAGRNSCCANFSKSARAQPQRHAIFFFFVMPRMEPRASSMLGKHPDH